MHTFVVVNKLRRKMLKKNPLRELSPFTRDEFGSPFSLEIDKLFNNFFGKPFFEGVKKSNFPKLDAYYTEAHDFGPNKGMKSKLVVNFAVAGVTKEDLVVKIDNDILEVSGKISEWYSSKNEKHCQIRELVSGSFKRQLRLPPEVVPEPEATLKDGILTLVFPVKEPEPEEPKGKRIEIK